MAFKKKLHTLQPDQKPEQVQTQYTKQRQKSQPSDPVSIERGVRQMLADKVCGTLVGLWLLIPEHLRLGTWDLLCGWSRQPSNRVEPRLALQLVHEAALCVTGLREKRCLIHKGFEAANGLPFVASDQSIHHFLNAHTVAEAQNLQCALGRIRRLNGHFKGQILAIDPHRMRSYSKRQMPQRCRRPQDKAVKTAQTFFCLDADTAQPVCFTTGTAARTAARATPELLDLTSAILQPQPAQPLVLADSEHFTVECIESIRAHSPFDLLVPMPNQPCYHKQIHNIPEDQFIPQWAGMATTTVPFRFANSKSPPLYQIVQRCGEQPENYTFKSFISSSNRSEIELLCEQYPKRWHIEEFFCANQDLGWRRAGTLNLHIRYAQMTLALIAQAAIHQLRERLGNPIASWDALHLGRNLFQGLDGDIRVHTDTIVVTFYNAPNRNRLLTAYEHLPEKLLKEDIDPRIPWLYGLKLDFRFR